MAAIAGTAGQANYAVANAFLDAMCLEARQRGKPFVSINWGPWGGSGMAVETPQGERRYQTLGITPLCRTEGMSLLTRLPTSSAGQRIVINANWNRAAYASPSGADSRAVQNYSEHCSASLPPI